MQSQFVLSVFVCWYLPLNVELQRCAFQGNNFLHGTPNWWLPTACFFFYQIDAVTTFIHSCLFGKCQLVDRVYFWFIHPPPKYGTSLVSSDNLSPALHLSFFTLSPFICQKKKDWLITVNIYWQNNSWQIYRSDDEPRSLVCQIWIPNRTDLFLGNTNQKKKPLDWKQRSTY